MKRVIFVSILFPWIEHIEFDDSQIQFKRKHLFIQYNNFTGQFDTAHQYDLFKYFASIRVSLREKMYPSVLYSMYMIRLGHMPEAKDWKDSELLFQCIFDYIMETEN